MGIFGKLFSSGEKNPPNPRTFRYVFLLVRRKFDEELQGIPDSPTAEEYKKACELFPAMMTIAHQAYASRMADGGKTFAFINTHWFSITDEDVKD